ncbi:MAG: hypothetical protein PHP52_03460 [Bacteroidales bacterium]|nr:hypothetical protein [Bacteroidales bacterium]MDD4217933.1 hypothetical protein [Bacteroidales bacterium]MDY0143182.1 hypothetical protein [Bacteroidales bacterium]
MTENKEIDIIGLIAKSVLFLKKHIIIIVVITLLSALIGVLEFYLGKNHYEVNLIATSPNVDREIVYEIADPIKYYIHNEMYDTVSQQLNVDLKVAQCIRKIELDTSLTDAVIITLNLYSKDYIQEVQDGFMYYFNELPYFKSQLTKRQNEINTYINVLEQEIDDLNEMQEAVLRNMNDENNSQMISVGGLFSEMVEIYDRKVELEQEYKSLHSFSLVNNNIIFLAQKSLKKNLALSLVIGFLIACCVGLGIETTKKIRKAIN